MQFTQIEFLLFWLGIVLLVRGADRISERPTVRHAILLVASYYFYAYWDWRFCGLLLLSTLVDYRIARRIDSTSADRTRRVLLAASVFANVGLLGFFKYCNFFIESANQILGPIGFNTRTLEIVLPVGISFFTFQTLSYTIDVYRRRIPACDSPLRFGLYVAFFPQLVAGPIVRASELLPQFERAPPFSTKRFYGGLQCVLRGLVKKVLIADRLGEFVDVVFVAPELYSGVTVWLAVIAYSGQIYYDFSGYTDIAIGVAKTLGYRFPKNFRHPYLATSVTAFWRRWHMTLSRWLRDYVYISLGGNRRGTARTLCHLMVTMVLGGLWHGAAWTFVFWGVLHGIALGTERVCRRKTRLPIPPVIRWLAVMTLVGAGWVLFRSPTMDIAWRIFAQMFRPVSGIFWAPPLVLTAVVVAITEHLAWQTRLRNAMRLRADRWYTPIGVSIMIWCLLLYAPRDFSPFVYFQF